MPSVTLTNVIGVYPVGVGHPIITPMGGASNLIDALRGIGYIHTQVGQYLETGNFCQLRVLFQPTTLIPPSALISAIRVNLGYNHNVVDSFVSPCRLIFGGGVSPAIDLPIPANQPIAADPPSGFSTGTFTSTLFIPLTIGEIPIFVQFNSLFDGGNSYDLGPLHTYLDYLHMIFDFTLDTPTVRSFSTTESWMNRFVVQGVLQQTAGNVNETYPITYYFEWTSQDPTLGSSDVTSTSPPQTISQVTNITSVGPASLSVFTLPKQIIPSNFSITDPDTFLMPNHKYWIRLVCSNISGTTVGSWNEVSTLRTDRIVI